MKLRDVKFMFWLGSIKKMSHPVRLKNIGEVMGKSLTKSVEAFQFTGFQDKNKKDIYEGHIFRITEELDGGDDVNYTIVTWVKEWGLFANLLHDEYLQYKAKGVDALDESMFWTYPLTDSNEMAVIGHIKTDWDKMKYPSIEAELEKLRDSDFGKPFTLK